MRLGYLYDLSWGGTAGAKAESIFPRLRGAAPGAKVQFDHEGLRVPRLQDRDHHPAATGPEPGRRGKEVETVRVGETNYTASSRAAASIRCRSSLRRRRQLLPAGQVRPPGTSVAAKSVYTYGGLAASSWQEHAGAAVGRLPPLPQRSRAKPLILFQAGHLRSRNQFAWSVSGEGRRAAAAPQDFRRGWRVKDQTAIAGAVQGDGAGGYLRASSATPASTATSTSSSVTSRASPFETDVPRRAPDGPRCFHYARSADYHIPQAHLTPGIGGGLQLPSTFAASSPTAASPRSRVIIVRQCRDESILPYNKERRPPILQARLSMRWDILRDVRARRLGPVRSATTTAPSSSATPRRFPPRSQSPNLTIGAAVAVQARF